MVIFKTTGGTNLNSMGSFHILVLICYQMAASIARHITNLNPVHEQAILNALGMRPPPKVKNSEHESHRDHTSERRNQCRIIQVPDNLRKLYNDQTGKDIPPSYCRKPVGQNDTYLHNDQYGYVRKFIGTPLKKVSSIAMETVFKFDFGQEVYNRASKQDQTNLGKAQEVNNLSAQLKVYWKPDLAIVRDHGCFRVRVYDIIKSDIVSMLDVKKINHRCAEEDEGWYVFDVTYAVLRWLNVKKSMKSPKISNRLMLKKSEISVVKNSANTTISTKKESKFSVIPTGIFQEAILHVYSKGRKSHVAREKRHAYNTNQRRNNQRTNKHGRRKNKNCRLRKHLLDFEEVGWNDWIMAPPGLQLNYCSGECNFPFHDRMNASNHAIVQSMVRSTQVDELKNPKKEPKFEVLPKACCVPTKLSPISLLFLDEHAKVILKTYDDMVIDECGCR